MISNATIEMELNECEGYFINKRLLSFLDSFLIYCANVNEIKKWHEVTNDPHVALTMWNPENYLLMDHANVEMQRLFTNFLSSAFSLRDHLYTLRNEYYEGTNIDKRIQESISKHFENNCLTAFIQNFRNFVIHCGYPTTSKKISINDGQLSNDVYFDKAQLYKFKNWNVDARKYLDTIGERIKLMDIVTDYDKIINDYYSEIISILKEYHYSELKKLKAIKDKYNLKFRMIKI